MEKAHRVHAGLRYCTTCYYRCFKSTACASCGQMARLLTTEQNAVCDKCLNRRPCARCLRVGLPVGKLTPYGPVCMACRKYFSVPKVCEVCGKEDRCASRVRRLWGDKIVCYKCARVDFRHCVRCLFPGICEPDEQGRITCARCRNGPDGHCKGCGISIPAGLKTQCWICRERQRLRHRGYGLAELLRTHDCREAFRAYVDWLGQSRYPAKHARELIRHVDLFVEVERRGLSLDDGSALLQELGTLFLRRHLLVTRWLEEVRSCNIGQQQRADASDRVRLKSAVEELAENSAGRRLAEQFMAELSDAVSAGSITIRTARLSMRPAVDLLKRLWQKGILSVTQDELISFLREKPGQRAAIARFVGFVRRTTGSDLVFPRADQISKLPFTGSDQAVRLHLMKEVRDAQFVREWLRLMLVHLHRLSDRAAARVSSRAEVVAVEDGYNCRLGSDSYWIPRAPNMNIAHKV